MLRWPLLHHGPFVRPEPATQRVHIRPLGQYIVCRTLPAAGGPLSTTYDLAQGRPGGLFWGKEKAGDKERREGGGGQGRNIGQKKKVFRATRYRLPTKPLFNKSCCCPLLPFSSCSPLVFTQPNPPQKTTKSPAPTHAKLFRTHCTPTSSSPN